MSAFCQHRKFPPHARNTSGTQGTECPTPAAAYKRKQHCGMLHVASVCTPCCMLRVSGSCCAKFETAGPVQTDATLFANNSQHFWELLRPFSLSLTFQKRIGERTSDLRRNRYRALNTQFLGSSEFGDELKSPPSVNQIFSFSLVTIITGH